MLGNLVYHDVQQGSEEWFKARLGHVTGSKAVSLLSDPNRSYKGRKGREGLSVGAWTLVYRLADCIVQEFDEDRDDFESHWMSRGTELEPIAIKKYERHEFIKVDRPGFISVEDRLAGFSPDFSIPSKNCGGEVKCLSGPRHLRSIEDNHIAREHLAQINWGLFCSGWEKWVMVHYHPRYGLHIRDIYPDPEMQNRYAVAFPVAEKKIKSLAAKYADQKNNNAYIQKI